MLQHKALLLIVYNTILHLVQQWQKYSKYQGPVSI